MSQIQQKIAVKTIRESGGNIAKKFFKLPPMASWLDSSVNSPFQFTDDSKYNTKNKLLFSAYM